MDSSERLVDFSTKYDITYPQWRDPGMSALSQLTEQGVIPRTVVLDKDHRILLRELGYTEQKFKRVVGAVQAALGREPDAHSTPVAEVAPPQAQHSSAFELDRVDTLATEGGVGFFTTVAAGPDGMPAVACKDYGRGALLVNSWAGGAWRAEYVDSESAGWSPSIAFDDKGNLGVSYGVGTGDFEVRYAHRVDGTWTVETVDRRGNPFKATSLVYTDAGDPLISYFARDEQDLRLARWNATASRWDVEVVDAVGDVGTYTSLALDSKGNPRIAYYDEGLQVLKFAAWTGDRWDRQVVDAEGQVGLHCSLAMDSSGSPSIAYFDLSNEDLKIARWTGSTWDRGTIDREGTVGQRCSLEFDSKGRAVVSYFGNGTLKLARSSGDGWDVMTVDESGLTGNYTSLALGDNDDPLISYFDVSAADLKFAWMHARTH